MTSALVDRGQIGEEAFNRWLSRSGMSYVSLCQAPERFAPLFSENVKRPDFLVLFESVGLLAVDVKNYSSSRGFFTLELEAELRRSLAFERLFRLPLWYAYYEKVDAAESWYWISALKAVEVGEVPREEARRNEVPCDSERRIRAYFPAERAREALHTQASRYCKHCGFRVGVIWRFTLAVALRWCEWIWGIRNLASGRNEVL